MEYITLRLDSTTEVEQWYVRHNYFIVLYHRRHVSTYIQVIFRPSITDKSMSGTTIFIVLFHRRHVSTYIQVIFRPSITDKSMSGTSIFIVLLHRRHVSTYI